MRMKRIFLFCIISFLLFSCNSEKNKEYERLVNKKQEQENVLKIFLEQSETRGIIGTYSYSTDTWHYSKRDSLGNVTQWTETGYMTSPTQMQMASEKVTENTIRQVIKEIDDSIKALNQ